MAYATPRGRSQGRWVSLLCGGLIAALLVSVTSPTVGQPAKDKKDDKKAKPEPAAPTPPPPLVLNVVGKDSKDQQTTVELVKLINTKLKEGWEANKVVQSKWADDYEFIRR